MPSYYKKHQGSLQPGKLARAEDIHTIQNNTDAMIHDVIVDMFGPAFILGGAEDDFKLVPTTDYIDQFNDVNNDDDHFVSFRHIYLKQEIYIEKSSIKDITVYMVNKTNTTPTVYAEIRDFDDTLIQEAHTTLPPTPEMEPYSEVTFNFNCNHLDIGQYYFTIRPVNLSAADLAENGDESLYDTIRDSDFIIKTDVYGNYMHGLQASYDGSFYNDAYLLDDDTIFGSEYTTDIDNPNFDLYFEERYASGTTFLIQNEEGGCAVVNGQRVDAFDTHVSIDSPSENGDRIDLVVLDELGHLNVKSGEVGQNKYPDTASGLKIAYITTYKNGEKISLIEQNDEDRVKETRVRDVLERIRRLEKKTAYQEEYNSPNRIKYNIPVDPVLYNNGLKTSGDKEGTKNMGLSTNAQGNTVVAPKKTYNYMWSILDNQYTYSYEKTVKDNVYCEVFNTRIPSEKPQNNNNITDDMCYIMYLSEDKITNLTNRNKTLDSPLPDITATVTIKKRSTDKGSTVKYTKKVLTNNKGKVVINNLWDIKLPVGKYNVYTKIGNNKEIHSFLEVYEKNKKTSVPKIDYTYTNVKVSHSEKKTVTSEIPDSVIDGDDGFSTAKAHLDTTNGTVEILKTDNSKNPYVTSNFIVNDNKYFRTSTISYPVRSANHEFKSNLPILHFKFDRDTYIKSITPYIKSFKNIDKIGIILFKNDKVMDIVRHDRITMKKEHSNDPVYPNVYDSGYKNLPAFQTKDEYQIPKSPITFEVDKSIEKGTYTLIFYAKVDKKHSEGEINIEEFDTHGNMEYGLAGKCIAPANLSFFKIGSGSLTQKTWNCAIKHKPHTYYEEGTLTSPTKTLMYDIKSCRINKYIKIPEGCTADLFVSNNGGGSWVKANSNLVTFKAYNNSFKWKLIMKGNGIDTPQLYYNNNKKYAIKFTLNTSSQNVDYEDYDRCYETPLLNANSVTQAYLHNTGIQNGFSMWEFARLFAEDEAKENIIDIGISHGYDVYTNANNRKDDWSRGIFFNQYYSDLTLNDFNNESVDYDNYEGSVEFDEHNYRFKLDTNDISGAVGQVVLATPEEAYEGGVGYRYGNINDDNKKDTLENYIDYSYEAHDHEYIEDDDNTTMYNGVYIKDGSYYKATFKNDEYNLNDNYIITGISFEKGLDINENQNTLQLQLYLEGSSPNNSETDLTNNNNEEDVNNDNNELTNQEKNLLENANDVSAEGNYIPKDTFKIVLSTTDDGSLNRDENGELIDVTLGKEYTINQKLWFNKYNLITIKLEDDVDVYATDRIKSIGVLLAKKNNFIQRNNAIGMGYVATTSYHIMPYVPYTYTEKDDRFNWEIIDKSKFGLPEDKDNNYIYNICRGIYNNDRSDAYTFFYPTERTKRRTSRTTLTARLSPEPFQKAHKIYGTSVMIGDKQSRKIYGINRKGTNLQLSLFNENNTGKDAKIYETKNTGNNILFICPQNVTGELFRIHTNIPYNIYNLIDIQYYMFNTMVATDETEVSGPNAINTVNNKKYLFHYGGSISKGEIIINLYDNTDTNNSEPIESFVLPAWGLVQQRSYVKDKRVNAWFKRRTTLPNTSKRIKAITIERRKVGDEPVENLQFVLHDINFYTAEDIPALGPQMIMRIYPPSTTDDENSIRKVGGIYRI